MSRKFGIICTICLIVGIAFCNFPQKPKIISSITSLDTGYLTILVDECETKDVEKLEAKIVQMCREDAFENIKLEMEDKPMAQKLIISVYTSKKDLEKGIPFLIIKNDAGN